ncbi:MAG: YaaL family protein [Lachnospiraceae bacterium]|nr:YaaL family protein [Lachnospiraceae bacterium]
MLVKKDSNKNNRKDKKKPDPHHEELLRELEATKNALDTAYANLSYVIEPELIDCCIYELNAVQLRYKFILSQVKNHEALSYSEKLSK